MARNGPRCPHGGLLGFWRSQSGSGDREGHTIRSCVWCSHSWARQKGCSDFCTLPSSADSFLTQRLEVETLTTDEEEGFICNVFCSSWISGI